MIITKGRYYITSFPLSASFFSASNPRFAEEKRKWVTRWVRKLIHPQCVTTKLSPDSMKIAPKRRNFNLLQLKYKHINIANLNGVSSVSKIKNPSILEALIIFVFPAIQRNMMSTRHSLSVDDKDVCAFAFETWKNVRFTFISFYTFLSSVHWWPDKRKTEMISSNKSVS